MTEVVEAIVLDVRLKGRGPAPLPTFVNIDVAVIPVQRDSAGGTRRTLKKMQRELENKFPPSPKQPITHINEQAPAPETSHASYSDDPESEL